VDAEERFRQLVQVASALQVARRWEQAGRAWIEAARLAIDASATSAARQALDAAGEAFRRDDRLEEARRALDMVMELRPTADEASLVRIRLAGIAAEQGRVEEGLACCRSITKGPPALRAMALDTEIGLLWLGGRKVTIRERLVALVELERLLPREGTIAARFRTAQLLRADGELLQAEAQFLALIEELRGREGSDAGIAAIRSELAENDLLRGETESAIEGFGRARELHATAGRQGLAFRAEGGRVRAAVQAGLDILCASLDEGLVFATDRSLRSLELELRVALGTLLAFRGASEASSVLKAAIQSASGAGMRLLAGRARLELATRTPLPPEQRQRELEHARSELEDHLPLSQLAARALASDSGQLSEE
jgi:tetratricopeptide (TPR) repeat protein